jgi:hypothetical protein
MPEFRLPGAENRLTVIGRTGTGKTVFGAWVLSKQHFDKRPWILLDFKNETLWDQVGDPPIRDLKLGKLPSKVGAYRVRINPGDDDKVNDYLWDIWKHENIGIFCDEASLVKGDGFKAILRQGRSKRIPVIACTQRPVGCEREIFSEADYLAVFKLNDIRDYRTVEEVCSDAEIRAQLPPYCCHWYDAKQSHVFTLKPTPDDTKIAADLKSRIPYGWSFW